MTRGLVCIVDDDESLREALGGFLRSLDYDVEAFPSAEAFLSAGAASRARCLILDVCMPGLGGPELQPLLPPELPVIFVTARPTETIERQVLAAGARAFLPKPFDHNALERILGSITRD